MKKTRLSRLESWKELEYQPNYEAFERGEIWDFTIFKEGFFDANFSNLSLPRSYFGRSRLERVSFQNTDLHGSHLCWNNFSDCDFSNADLDFADLRASIFLHCQFRDCCLVRADLRASTFENCDFEGADLRDAKITRVVGKKLILTPQQRSVVRWQSNDGPEPEGG